MPSVSRNLPIFLPIAQLRDLDQLGFVHARPETLQEIVNGKRVLSRVFCGRYSLDKGMTPVRVSLNTPDREVVRKRLRAIVVEKQREAEGIVAPKAVRVAAGTQLGQLVSDYEADLRGRELNPKHVRDTTTRVRRMIAENNWKVLIALQKTRNPRMEKRIR